MKNKRIISVIIAMALSAAMITAFAADTVTNTDIDSSNVVVQTDDGTVLTEGIDYTLEYKDNVNVGTATVIVHFIGNYSGEAEQTFNIKKKTSGCGGGGGGSVVSNKPNITAKEEDGKTVNITHKEEDDKIIVTLPDGVDLDPENPITVTVKDTKGKPSADKDVVVKDKMGNEASGKTDNDGKITVPSTAAVTPMPTAAPPVEQNFEHKAYISGYEDGTFKPDSPITRAETASMLNGVISVTDKGNDITFTDLKDGAWYIPAVTAMTAADVIHGYTDGTLRPDNNITRAEFITMIMQSKDISKFDNLPFSDVNTDLWSADYIYSAYTAGYINGYGDGTFKPDSPITRAEAVRIINSVLDRTDFSNETNPFSDISSKHWAYKQILEAAVTHEAE